MSKKYSVEKTGKGSNSSYSIYDENGKGCGFSFEHKESADNYLHNAEKAGKDPQQIDLSNDYSKRD